MTSKAKWTFMVYLAGDNNLCPAADVDLKEMRTVGSTKDLNIVAQVDRAEGQGSRRYCIQCNGEGEQPENLGEKDSGDPKTVTDFVTWTAENYPAERYALILWNHGGGWEPSEMDHIARSAGTPQYSPREATERSATPLARTLFRTSLQKIFSLSSPAERAICSDDGSGHSLDTVELGNVLHQAVKSLGQPLDLLGMDACLMSNLEVAYQVQPYAKYMVASEENEPNNGWPYDAVMRTLVDDVDQPTAKLAEHIVNKYIKSYVEIGYEGAVTQAACDLSKVNEVVDPLDKLADALVAYLPEAANEVWKAQKNSARFWHNTLWDVSHFCKELSTGTSNKSVRNAAEDVRAALQSGPDRFIIAEAHNGPRVEHCAGSTIYLVPPITNMSRYYEHLDYAQKHRWLPFLKAYHAA
ncbi:MAG: clostripain-related cysteine peptidase [Acidobacteriota bacterium]